MGIVRVYHRKSNSAGSPSRQIHATNSPESPVYDNFPPSFWDNLRTVHLTGRALRELDRRNGIGSAKQGPPVVEKLDPIDIRLFACHGGPDLRHIIMPATTRACQSRHARPRVSADQLSRSRKCSAYCENFETHLKYHGIYMADAGSRPLNEQEILAALEAKNPSLSASSISKDDFDQFQEMNRTLNSEAYAATHLFPVICAGTVAEAQPNVLFSEMAPIAGDDIAAAKPDFFYGSPKGNVKKRVLEDLQRLISPSSGLHVPVVPNFYAALKGPRGNATVLERQACFDGAHGARAMHCLQNYGTSDPIYDGNAYTYSATYHPKPGILQLYAHHVTAPSTLDALPEYHMTLLDCWIMTRDIQSFRRAICAFRNARELAKHHRDAFIQAANARAKRAVAEFGKKSPSSIKRRRHVSGSSSEPVKRLRTSLTR